MPTPKQARRFLRRRSHKMAEVINGYRTPTPSFVKWWRKCMKIVEQDRKDKEKYNSFYAESVLSRRLKEWLSKLKLQRRKSTESQS